MDKKNWFLVLILVDIPDINSFYSSIVNIQDGASQRLFYLKLQIKILHLQAIFPGSSLFLKFFINIKATDNNSVLDKQAQF